MTHHCFLSLILPRVCHDRKKNKRRSKGEKQRRRKKKKKRKIGKMMIGRRNFLAGLICAPALVRASSLDFVPRDLTQISRKQWWWNPKPMCGQDVGFFFGRKPKGFGWRNLDQGADGYPSFHEFPRGPVRSINPEKYKTIGLAA